MILNRRPLPNRRENVTVEVKWCGVEFTVTPGYDPETGDLAEVFADCPKGGQMAFTLADACVLISVALQHGITVDQISKSLSRVPDTFVGGDASLPASPVGAIIEALA